jgi:hypothetical protein
MKIRTSGNLFAIEPGDLLINPPEAKKLTKIKLPDPITNCCFDDTEDYFHVAPFCLWGPVQIETTAGLEEFPVKFRRISSDLRSPSLLDLGYAELRIPPTGS